MCCRWAGLKHREIECRRRSGPHGATAGPAGTAPRSRGRTDSVVGRNAVRRSSGAAGPVAATGRLGQCARCEPAALSGAGRRRPAGGRCGAAPGSNRLRRGTGEPTTSLASWRAPEPSWTSAGSSLSAPRRAKTLGYPLSYSNPPPPNRLN